MSFPSIRIEGNIISQEILSKLEEGEYPGQLAKDFGFDAHAKVKDEIAFSWATAKDYWRIFQRKIERLPETATATSETRSDWMKPLLELLGYQIETSRAEIINEKSYAISHRVPPMDSFPIHIMGYRDDIDKKRTEGGPRMSPHGLLQEYLNVSEHLYGLVSNGRYLRLLRDSGRLVRLSFAEFDLQRMMEDDLYADFAIMFRLLHCSRMPKRKDAGDESLIERYHQDSLDAGSRIRERLSKAVEQSIISLGNGFLQHPQNHSLKASITSGTLRPETYFQQLLRLIYRFLFLMVTEERDLIYPDVTNPKRELYYKFYSFERLRKLSEQRHYNDSRYDDLWEGLKITFRFFENKHFGEKIGILPLDGDLFGSDALGEIANSRLMNDTLLQCIYNLNVFQNEQGQLIRVNYGSLDVEEFGSVYEGLLEYDPALSAMGNIWSFSFVKGEKRSSTSSHYTPEELVQPLIKHSLDYIIEEKLKQAEQSVSKQADKETLRQAKRDALLSIKVCDPASGSGHILLSAARRIATVLAQVMTDEEQPSPKAFREAIREVIRHCIYGVDKNPLAVELCKVALWLEAHNPGMPLTFLDHRIRCGDSVVGVGRIEELHKGIPTEAFKTLPGDDKEIASELRKRNKKEIAERISSQLRLYNQEDLRDSLNALASDYEKFSALPDRTVEDFHTKREQFRQLHGHKWMLLKQIADVQTAQFFLPKTLENRNSLATDAKYVEIVTNTHVNYDPPLFKAQAVSGEQRFFHWFLEFPDVFATKGLPAEASAKAGFDCILGNPPFLGGQKISGTFGDAYLNWLKCNYDPAQSCDLVAFFFRRVFDLLRDDGGMSLLATNTIAQGDARETALDVILSRAGTINFAIRSMRWPGMAAVEVALVSIHKGKWKGERVLGNRRVAYISSYLDDAEDLGKPFRLKQNENKSFQGSIVLGKGFVLTPQQAQELIARNPKNKDVLFPYLNGEDLNSRPDQSPSRWVINFFDWPLDRTADGCWELADEDERDGWLKSGIVPKDYPDKVAADYPDCLEIVERLVKPERMEYSGEKNSWNYSVKKYWWRFGAWRRGLDAAIAPLERVLVVARVTKYVNPSVASAGIVFADQLIVFALPAGDYVGIFNSTIHQEWAWKNCSTMGASTLRYAPTDSFEGFPFPTLTEELINQGKNYDVLRSKILKQCNVGLTALYNFFHNSNLTSEIIEQESKQSKEVAEQAYQDILTLRQLHKEMDEAVLAAYGWQDLNLEHGFHEVEYLPENDRIRYTISEKARKEVLRRLLKLNHEIHEKEMKEGIYKAPKKKVGVVKEPSSTPLFGEGNE